MFFFMVDISKEFQGMVGNVSGWKGGGNVREEYDLFFFTPEDREQQQRQNRCSHLLL